MVTAFLKDLKKESVAALPRKVKSFVEFIFFVTCFLKSTEKLLTLFLCLAVFKNIKKNFAIIIFN